MELLNQLLQALAAPDHPSGDEGIEALRAELVDADAQDLEDLRSAALEQFDALYDEESTPSDDDLTSLEHLSMVIDAATLESASRGEAEAAARDRASQLAQRARAGTPGEPSDPISAPNEAQPDLPVAEEVPAAVEGELVAAGYRGRANDPTSFAGLPRSSLPDAPRTRLSLVAAADVPGFASGSPLNSIEDLGRAIENRFHAMPKGVPNTRVELGLAVMQRHRPDSEAFEVFGDGRDMAVVDAAASEARLPGGSLVASGGWCAEPEISFELCPSLATLDGLVTTPSVTIRRGGIRYPDYPDWQTIAASISGQILCAPNFDTEKECVAAPCVTWRDFVPCAIPLCVTNDILMERGFPELVSRFASDVLVAQAHMVNAYILSQFESMVDDTVTSSLGVSGATHSVFDELSLLAEWYRDLYRMGSGASLEMIGPAWLPAVLRADARKRTFDGGDWTLAQINARLSAVGASPQWVRDWQPLAEGTGEGTPVFNPPTGWPETVQILLYPAGTFVVGRADIINLNAIYDSVLLRTNKYTALFAEEMITIIKRCSRAVLVEIPICPNGAMGPQVDNCAATGEVESAGTFG